MSKQFGYDLLAQQVADHLASEWAWMSTSPNAMTGDTPIEKLLFAALLARCQNGACEYSDLRIAQDEKSAARLLAERTPDLRLVVWPQAPVGQRRVDFLVMSYSFNAERYRHLIVECDGHDFHERTKEQAAKDRSKDRAALMDGIDSFRFTGSEIWRDPWGCAEQITNWAAKGLC